MVSAGCSRQQQEKEDSWLEIVLSSRFRQNSENPYASAVIALNPFYSLVYRPLFFFDEELRLKSIFVESYSWNKNTLTLKLFPDACFSDGSQLTAYDVKISLERSLREAKEPSPLFHYIVDSEPFLKEKWEHLPSISIINNQTLKIEFTEYIPDFMYYMGSIIFCILNHDYQKGVKFNGPFYLEHKVEKENETLLYLRPNPYYRLRTGRERPICLHFFRSEEKVREAVKNGTGDMFFEFMMQKEFEIHPSYRLHKAPMLGGFIGLINLQSGKF
ncbi:MAG: ABC transporter substrate-binding protein, partial [Candidatus Paceibacteria bacterium]